MSKLCWTLIGLVWLVSGGFCDSGGGLLETSHGTSFWDVTCVQCEREFPVTLIEQSEATGITTLTVLAENFTEDMWNKCLYLNVRYTSPFLNLVPPTIYCVTESASMKLQIKVVDDSHSLTIEKVAGLFFGASEVSSLTKLNSDWCQARHVTVISLTKTTGQCNKYNRGQESQEDENILIITLKFIICTNCNPTQLVQNEESIKEISQKEIAVNEKAVEKKSMGKISEKPEAEKTVGKAVPGEKAGGNGSTREKAGKEKAAMAKTTREKVTGIAAKGWESKVINRKKTVTENPVKNLHATKMFNKKQELLQIFQECLILSMAFANLLLIYRVVTYRAAAFEGN